MSYLFLFRQQGDTVSTRSCFRASLRASIFPAEMSSSDSESSTSSVCTLELILLFVLCVEGRMSRMMSYSVTDQYSITKISLTTNWFFCDTLLLIGGAESRLSDLVTPLLIDKAPQTDSWDSQTRGYNRCGIKRATQSVTAQSEPGSRRHLRNKQVCLCFSFFCTPAPTLKRFHTGVLHLTNALPITKFAINVTCFWSSYDSVHFRVNMYLIWILVNK